MPPREYHVGDQVRISGRFTPAEVGYAPVDQVVVEIGLYLQPPTTTINLTPAQDGSFLTHWTPTAGGRWVIRARALTGGVTVRSPEREVVVRHPTLR